ncbi:predicted protein [Naegleria gruberi]|uniref:Predicted protein n=1 Tax=Naegleria gruberi TaxID=5762 RepID=D2W663_NAEGR|nr:uncharacterized protein NAEGRDRAFT_76906 [Naegleria gruberi]EFC35440.1 predicted protein [Naegleria gruberi]|eukprot:XP_002668184.1 predicted protein [Naegleria gruberi strain NEG-M]
MGNKQSNHHHHQQQQQSSSTSTFTPTTIPVSNEEAYRREMEICRQYEIESKMREMHEAKFHQYSENKEPALQNLQLVLIIDHSGSMGSFDEDATGQNRSKGLVDSNHWTRYDNVIQAAKYLSESILQYDKDGKVPLIFFDSNVREVIVDSIPRLVAAFEKNQPNSSTNLLGALELAFKNHVNDHENVLFIVFTDGSPNGESYPKAPRGKLQFPSRDV